MTDEELQAIQARCDAARAGPWTWIEEQFDDPEGGGKEIVVRWVVISDDDEQVSLLRSGFVSASSDGSCEIDNAVFVAHARTDVPALLAEVRHLRELLSQYEAS